MSFCIKLVLITVLLCRTNCELQLVPDEELIDLIQNEKYVAALFTTQYCEECEIYENHLAEIRSDLAESLGSWVVKLVDSSLTRLYTPHEEPALVFFRHGVPLLYDGVIDEEVIFHTLSDNREPTVKELNDDNFEHLTQAATGATTGDWLIQFYTTGCVECQRMQARWEAVGAKLKSQRTNVAVVNAGGSGAKTARRFRVDKVPTFILFKKGNMYPLNPRNYDIDTFVSFVQEEYKHISAVPVPQPTSVFVDVGYQLWSYIVDYPYVWAIFVLSVLVGLSCSLVLKYFERKNLEDRQLLKEMSKNRQEPEGKHSENKPTQKKKKSAKRE